VSTNVDVDEERPVTDMEEVPPRRVDPRRTPAKPSRVRRRVIVVTIQVLLLVVLLGAWELSADLGWSQILFTSKPTDIAVALWTGLTQGELLSALGTTMYETLIGFVISAVGGVLLGLLLYSVPIIEEVLRPFISALNSLPRLALAPLFILWFGIGSLGRVALVVTITVFIVLLNTLAGLQTANSDHLTLAKTLGAGPWQRFQKFLLPSAAPTIFAGLQLGLTFSFLGAVIAELISGGSGLGAEISKYQSNFVASGMFAAIFLIGVVAVILAALMRLAERSVMAWREIDLRGVNSTKVSRR
jgi:NitT/TauT family transport system permease protein